MPAKVGQGEAEPGWSTINIRIINIYNGNTVRSGTRLHHPHGKTVLSLGWLFSLPGTKPKMTQKARSLTCDKIRNSPWFTHSLFMLVLGMWARGSTKAHATYTLCIKLCGSWDTFASISKFCSFTCSNGELIISESTFFNYLHACPWISARVGSQISTYYLSAKWACPAATPFNHYYNL